MVQENELINLLMGLAALPALLLLARHGRTPRLPFFYAGFGAVLAAYVFTIIEGLLWFDVFNLLEHLSLAASGLLFCAALSRLPRDLDGREEDGP
ncbi:MAG: hypothetical protein HZB55_19420 [Deltaproteobacteria bacterium]|nr:hypothetical protein [Deltaproteobacteria bacterium]